MNDSGLQAGAQQRKASRDPSVPGGTGSVFQTTNNGREVWCASFSWTGEDGKRVFIRGYGGTKAEAIRRRMQNYQRRLSGAERVRRATSPTVEAYLETWLAERAGSGGTRASSLRKYRTDITNHILPVFGKTPLERLTPEELREFFYHRMDQSKTAARKHVYKNFNAMLNYAVKNEVIESNPLNKVAPPAHTTAVAEKDDKYATEHQMIAEQVLEWLADPECQYHGHYPRILFMFLGLRVGELTGLSWNDIDYLHMRDRPTVITIRQQLQNYTGEGWKIVPYLKSNSRTIGVPKVFSDALQMQKDMTFFYQSQRGPEFTELVFKHPDTGEAVTRTQHNRIWQQIIRDYFLWEQGWTEAEVKAEWERVYFRPHEVRHIAASMLFALGVPTATVQKILGHGSEFMTRYYTHIGRDLSDAAVGQLGDKLTSILGPGAGATTDVDGPDSETVVPPELTEEEVPESF